MKSVAPILFSLWIVLSPVKCVAKNIILSCSDSVNLYSDTYLVEIDRKNSQILIKRHFLASGLENQSYLITNVESDLGAYTITADGKLFNSHIIIQINHDISIQYTDAFTDRPIAVDRCIATSGINSKK